MKKDSITVQIDIATVLDGNPVALEYLRQAIREKKERDAGEKDAN